MRQHIVELGVHTSAPANAPPIVLIDGAGCNLEDMRLALGERLAARHRVILIDRPGLGYSERKGRRGSAPAYQAAMLRDALDRLGVDRAIVVGHSWGGALAAAFALDHPQRAAAVVLLAPTALSAPAQHDLALHGIRDPDRRLALCAHTGIAARRPLHATLPTSKRNLASQAARYAAFSVPVTVMTGSGDMIVPPRHHAKAFAAAVPAAKLVVLPGIGHMLHHVAAGRVIAEIEQIAKQI